MLAPKPMRKNMVVKTGDNRGRVGYNTQPEVLVKKTAGSEKNSGGSCAIAFKVAEHNVVVVSPHTIHWGVGLLSKTRGQ